MWLKMRNIHHRHCAGYNALMEQSALGQCTIAAGATGHVAHQYQDKIRMMNRRMILSMGQHQSWGGLY